MTIKSAISAIARPQFLAIIITVFTLFTSCDNGAEKRNKNLDELQTYIQNKKDSIDQFADNSWNQLDQQFNEKVADLEKDTAKMSEDQKSRYYQARRDWNDFKTNVSTRSAERAKIAQMDTIRKALTIDGVRPDFTDLAAPDVQRAYEHFVNTVKDRKDMYSKEEWTVVNVSWKALNGRKRELEKDLKADAKGKIVKLQLEYTGIKAVNRPLASSEE